MTTWNELAAQGNDEIVAWAQEQSWAHDMAVCQQDAQWHAEGDVWTHTRMVCRELERLEDWPTLDRGQQLKLLFTALFHDSGKPATTLVEPGTGRTRSPKHAAVGVQITRAVLRELECDLATREEICRLTEYHGRPPYLLERSDPEREVLRLSWLVNHRLLYLFALADTRGRDADEFARPEENLHLWKLVAEEQACFDRPFPFASDHARFLFYRGDLSYPAFAPHVDVRCTMTLLSGLPGAGKDTWLARNRPALPVVSLDEIRAELDVEATDNQGQVAQTARERCRELLRAGRDFAFNATNTVSQTRKRWIDLAADYHARIEIVYLEPPLAKIVAQNKRRENPVPERIIQRLVTALDPPTITECHALRMGD